MVKISSPFCEIRKSINATQEAVWTLITDTSRWTQWGPSVSEVNSTDRYIRKGTRGKVKLPIGIWIPFLITDYEDKRYWSWSVWGIRATGHRIEPLDEKKCVITFEVPTLAAPYLLVCWIAIRRIESILQNP